VSEAEAEHLATEAERRMFQRLEQVEREAAARIAELESRIAELQQNRDAAAHSPAAQDTQPQAAADPRLWWRRD
jgi:hypothetical protein